MWATPFALWGFLQLWIKAHQVIGPRTGVTQDNLSALLAHLTVILVLRLEKKKSYLINLKTTQLITHTSKFKMCPM